MRYIPAAGLLTVAAAYYYQCTGDYKKSEDFYCLALSVASQCNSDIAKIKPLEGLALTEWRHGNYPRALQLAQETYRIARVSGNIRGELSGIRVQAMCYSAMGDFNHGIALLDEGKELVVRGGLQGGQMESFLMSSEANLYQTKTEYSNARRIQEAVLHQTSAVLSPMEHAYALLNIAFLDIVTGISTAVVSHNLDAATMLFRNAQFPHGISWCECYRADVRHREGDLIGARAEYIRLFSAARESAEEIAYYCLARLADPTNPMHADMECERWAVVFLAYVLHQLVPSRLMVHQALRCLGDVLVGQGIDNSALSILTVALDGFTQMDVHQSRAECMRTMGDVYVERGDLRWAREMWEAARPLFDRAEQKKEVAKIDEKLQTLGVAQKLETIPQVQVTLQDSAMDNKDPGLILDL